MIRAVILLDADSKRKIKVDNSILGSDDVMLLEELKDIDVSLFGDGPRNVIVFDSALGSAESLSILRMYKDVAKLSYVFALSIKENLELASGLGRAFLCDTKILTYDLAQAILFNDTAYSSEAADLHEEEVYAKSLLGRDVVDADAVRMASDFLASVTREQALKDSMHVLQEKYEDVITKNCILEHDNKNWLEGYRQLMQKVLKQNKNLEQYETIFSQDVYTKLDLHVFPQRPIILYFKVFTDFIGINTFIETIVDTLRYQEQLSVKVLQLFDGSGDRKIRLLPEYYYRLHNYYTMKEVIDNNYLCKSGDYTNLVTRLLSNKYNLNVLIIVDCKDHDDTIFDGRFIQFDLCRTVAQARILALPQNNTIVNQSADGWLKWLPAKVDDLTERERLIKLGSRAVIGRVLSEVEKVRDSV